MTVFLLVCNAFGQPTSTTGLVEFVRHRINGTATSPSSSESTPDEFLTLCPIEKSAFSRRVFLEYGAIFAASDSVRLPPACIFTDAAAVDAFHAGLSRSSVIIAGVEINLQKPAAESLAKVVAAADELGVRIEPLDGVIAGGRGYLDTVRLWNSRFYPALGYWVRRGRISAEQESRIMSVALPQQVEQVIEWESTGIWFGTNKTSTIFSSTAPPGSSQHLSLLAFDVTPPITRPVRETFNAHGWFQTVKGDPPHFTYLGVPESELPRRGLKPTVVNGTRYWLPNVADTPQPIPSN